MSAVASAREALEAGRLMEAVDEARDVLQAHPGNSEALYLKALALSRLGAASLAAESLTTLLAQSSAPAALRADGFALRGRLLKDRAARAAAADRARFAAEACA